MITSAPAQHAHASERGLFHAPLRYCVVHREALQAEQVMVAHAGEGVRVARLREHLGQPRPVVLDAALAHGMPRRKARPAAPLRAQHVKLRLLGHRLRQSERFPACPHKVLRRLAVRPVALRKPGPQGQGTRHVATVVGRRVQEHRRSAIWGRAQAKLVHRRQPTAGGEKGRDACALSA